MLAVWGCRDCENVRCGMLPDFPNLKREVALGFKRLLRVEVRRRTPLAAIGVQKAWEGDKIGTVDKDGKWQTKEYEETTGNVPLDKRKVKDLGIGALPEFAQDYAEQVAEAHAKAFYKAADEAAASGSGAAAKGEGPLTMDTFLTCLDAMFMDFDDNDEPIGIEIHRPAQFAESDKAMLALWEKDPVFKARFDAIITKKREEWRARESNRKLVD